MERTLKDTYTVAVDDNSGRLVIIINGKVMGALMREISVRVAQDIIEWMPPLMRPTLEKDEVLNGTPS